MSAPTSRLADWPDELVYARNGDPLGRGPRCATCGALAAFDSHPICERRKGSLLVIGQPPSGPTLLDELRDIAGEINAIDVRRSDLVAQRDELIRRCLLHGYTQADLARVTGLTTARLAQITRGDR